MNSKNYILRSILFVVIGLILIIWPQETTKTIIMVIGGLLLAYGIVAITSFYSSRKGDESLGLSLPVGGLVCAVVGMLLLVLPDIFATIFMIVLGLLLVLGAIDQIYMLAKASKRGVPIQGWRYVVPVLVLIAGAIIAFNPDSSTSTMLMIFGVTAVVYGLADFVNQYTIRSGKRSKPQ